MTAESKVESRPDWGQKIVDGALWALGAALVGALIHKLFPSKPTIVVLADKGKADQVDEDE